MLVTFNPSQKIARVTKYNCTILGGSIYEKPSLYHSSHNDSLAEFSSKRRYK